jgi:hypothetical protein
VLFGDVRGEGFFSSDAIMFMASRASDALAVPDDPEHFSTVSLLLGEAGAFAWTRHLSLIFSMSNNVV